MYFHDACRFDAPQTYIRHVLAHWYGDVLYVCGSCAHSIMYGLNPKFGVTARDKTKALIALRTHQLQQTAVVPRQLLPDLKVRGTSHEDAVRAILNSVGIIKTIPGYGVV